MTTMIIGKPTITPLRIWNQIKNNEWKYEQTAYVLYSAVWHSQQIVQGLSRHVSSTTVVNASDVYSNIGCCENVCYDGWQLTAVSNRRELWAQHLRTVSWHLLPSCKRQAKTHFSSTRQHTQPSNWMDTATPSCSNISHIMMIQACIVSISFNSLNVGK